MNFSFSERLDMLCWDLLNRVPLSKQWLLKQTIYTSPVRRQWIATLPLQPGDTVADIGTGYGIMALEMADALKVHVIGIDQDKEVLAHARFLTESVYGSQSPLQFEAADAYHLPFADQSLDAITARFLFQHLTSPLLLSREIFRVLKPHARVFIEDIDDGFTIEFPPVPNSWQKVIHAFQTLQSLGGGDRFVGRKIPSYLHQAGLAVDAVQVYPLAQFSQQDPNGIASQFERERIEQVLPDLFSRRMLTELEWQAALRDLQASEGQWIFQSISQFRVTAHRSL